MALAATHEERHDDAIDFLTMALNDRPFTVYRTIFTFYQILEPFEYLYEKTGEDGYRAMGHELAKRFQIIQPMYPWAYAFVAKPAPKSLRPG